MQTNLSTLLQQNLIEKIEPEVELVSDDGKVEVSLEKVLFLYSFSYSIHLK